MVRTVSWLGSFFGILSTNGARRETRWLNSRERIFQFRSPFRNQDRRVFFLVSRAKEGRPQFSQFRIRNLRRLIILVNGRQASGVSKVPSATCFRTHYHVFRFTLRILIFVSQAFSRWREANKAFLTNVARNKDSSIRSDVIAITQYDRSGSIFTSHFN